MRKRMRLLYVLVIAFVIVAAGLLAVSRLDGDLDFLRERGRETREEEVEAMNLNGKLAWEITKKDDKDYVIDLARSRYDYLMPGEIRFEVVNPEVLGLEDKEQEEKQAEKQDETQIKEENP